MGIPSYQNITKFSRKLSKNMNKAALWREYGLIRPPKPRYPSNERKSVYWVLVSRFTRIRDWRKYGVCISCGVKIEHWEYGQAGHYAPAQGCGMGLLFDAYNVNMECPRCNGFDEGHLIGYRKGLMKRYGPAIVGDIESRYMTHRQNPGDEKEWTQEKYHEEIMILRGIMFTNDMIVKDEGVVVI